MLNPKHSTIPATRKKINSLPAETRTTISSFNHLRTAAVQKTTERCTSSEDGQEEYKAHT